ncbi:MAG: ABC-2 family transporter protein, partial [Spirochaetia bacterium]|nr:ABC-2 family transporter protein [Spirochaetia bacterium]
LSTLIKASMGRNESLISSRVKTGEIAVDLMKPYSIPLMYLADTIGATLFQIVSRAIPLLIFCYFVFEISIPVTPEILLKFFPVYLFSFIIFFLMLFLISSISFFIVDIFPLWIFYWSLITLTSGAIIPLDFFPEIFSRILLFTPFPYLFYFPTMILLDKTYAMPYPQLILYYSLIVLLLSAAAYGIFSTGIRKLSIAGG